MNSDNVNDMLEILITRVIKEHLEQYSGVISDPDDIDANAYPPMVVELKWNKTADAAIASLRSRIKSIPMHSAVMITFCLSVSTMIRTARSMSVCLKNMYHEWLDMFRFICFLSKW